MEAESEEYVYRMGMAISPATKGYMPQRVLLWALGYAL